MIAAIRQLPPEQQRQLIKLLDPQADLDDVADDETLVELTAVLRRALDVPGDGDLPDYLRRRLVEVAVRQFQVVDNVDMSTDMEVARTLVDFILDAAGQLEEDDERREEFETFLRTKNRAERARWLTQSQRIESLVNHEDFDRRAAQQRAEEVLSEQAAHRETAKAILAGLSSLATKDKRKALPTDTPGKVAAAAALGGTAGAALAPGIALTTGAVAGGLFMAGRARRDLVKLADEQHTDKMRAQRARRSKLVQNVVALCAFLAANNADAGE